jgi:hypothetical protein
MLSYLKAGLCRMTLLFAGIMVIPRDLSFVSIAFISASPFCWLASVVLELLSYAATVSKITILVPEGTAKLSRCNIPDGVSPGLPAFLTCTFIAFGFQHILQLCRPSLMGPYAVPSYVTGT